MGTSKLDGAQLAGLNARLQGAPTEIHKAAAAVTVAPELTDRDLAICTAFGISPVAYLIAKQRDADDKARLAAADRPYWQA